MRKLSLFKQTKNWPQNNFQRNKKNRFHNKKKIVAFRKISDRQRSKKINFKSQAVIKIM